MISSEPRIRVQRRAVDVTCKTEVPKRPRFVLTKGHHASLMNSVNVCFDSMAVCLKILLLGFYCVLGEAS